LGFISSM